MRYVVLNEIPYEVKASCSMVVTHSRISVGQKLLDQRMQTLMVR